MIARKLGAAGIRVAAQWRLACLKSSGVSIGSRVGLLGRPIVDVAQGSRVSIGDRCTLISDSRWTALGVSRPVILRTLLPGARIIIGSDVGMSGTTVCAAKSIVIGDRVLLGADVMIVDTDFHPVDEIPRRHLPIPPPNADDDVVIESDVFIGARSIVLKGSRVGAGAVIGAGSVVSGVVPTGAVVAGTPARFVRWVGASTAREEIDQ